MSAIKHSVIFFSPVISNEKFEALKASGEGFLYLRVNKEIVSGACDFFCDGGVVTRFDMYISSTTKRVCVYAKTATRLHPFAEDFEALSENQIYLFTHEGVLP